MLGIKSAGSGEKTGPLFGCTFVGLTDSGNGLGAFPPSVFVIGSAAAEFAARRRATIAGTLLLVIELAVGAADKAKDGCWLDVFCSSLGVVISLEDFDADSDFKTGGGGTRTDLEYDAAGALEAPFL